MIMRWICVPLGLAALMPMVARAANGYDPLAIDPDFHPAKVDLTVHDQERDRDIPVRIYLPARTSPQPVVLFSPGLGGARENYAYIGEHWAARGYVAVVLQHPGSDDSVWKDKSPEEARMAMREAASLKNFILRVRTFPTFSTNSKCGMDKRPMRWPGGWT